LVQDGANALGSIHQTRAWPEQFIGIDAVYLAPDRRGKTQPRPSLAQCSHLFGILVGRNDDFGLAKQNALRSYLRRRGWQVGKDIASSAYTQCVVDGGVPGQREERRVAD